MAFDLSDRFETTDGARPDATPLAARAAHSLPLAAFAVLRGQDAFEGGAPAGAEGLELAWAFLRQRVKLKRHFAPRAVVDRVRADVVAQLGHNPSLCRRLLAAKPLRVDLVPRGKPMSRYGFPDNVVPNAAGLFWDHPSWPVARVALRQEHLVEGTTLVFHELGHAIQYLAFSAEEQALLYRVLRPTFGSRAAMDEVFAIYSERELGADFTALERRAPGIYGLTRRQWSEDHLFTRFVRKLYLPHARLAGKEAREREGARRWSRFVG